MERPPQPSVFAPGIASNSAFDSAPQVSTGIRHLPCENCGESSAHTRTPSPLDFKTEKYRVICRQLSGEGFVLVSVRPFIMRCTSFMTKEQCEAVIANAEGHFAQSKLTGGVINPDIRSSWSSKNAIPHNIWKVVHGKIARGIEDGQLELEDPQVVRYTHGQKFKAHNDSSAPGFGRIQRPYTFFAYLNTVDKAAGGATTFVNLKPPLSEQPTQGTCLFWANWDEDGKLDSDTDHTGEAILAADVTKYGLNMWITPFD